VVIGDESLDGREKRERREKRAVTREASDVMTTSDLGLATTAAVAAVAVAGLTRRRVQYSTVTRDNCGSQTSVGGARGPLFLFISKHARVFHRISS